LSKVENNILTLNYDRLSALAAAFGLSLSEFLAEPRARLAGPRAVMARRSLFRHDKGEIVTTPNYEYRYQCNDLVAKGLVPIFVVVKARSLAEFGPLLHHEGEELVFVVKGQVTVHTEFYKPEPLGPLQGMYIDSTMGHAYINSGEGEAWMFSVNTSTHPASTLQE
jgi:mannose-6-phosphate isomerase-like protein (cupin superfamily)